MPELPGPVPEKPVALAYYFNDLGMPSTVVATYAYDEDKQSLTVTFVSGLVYEYFDVPPDVYQQMKSSGAKGIFLNKHIKGKFRFQKIDPPFSE